MEADSIQTHAHLETYYWWWVGRRRIIEKILQKYFKKKSLQILDWGCGTGGNFPMLEKFGTVLGVDSSEEALKFCREKGITNLVKAGNLEEFASVPSPLISPIYIGEKERGFDLVSAFDVLEHIEDDLAFLRGLHQFLAQDGFVMLTVPSYKFLWSELDDRVGHVRRYTRRELCTKLQQTGFVSIKASYFVASMFLPITAYRFLGKLTGRAKVPKFSYVEFPKPINWLLTKILFLEGALLPFLNFSFGTSIIVLAKRKL